MITDEELKQWAELGNELVRENGSEASLQAATALHNLIVEVERLRRKLSLAEVRARHGFEQVNTSENREQNLFDIEQGLK